MCDRPTAPKRKQVTLPRRVNQVALCTAGVRGDSSVSSPAASASFADEMGLGKRLVVVVGATGVGKTRLGIELAKSLGGEVLNADAIQMYKGLDVATAKASVSEMDGIPHHMLSFLNAKDTFTVRSFRDKALPIIEDICDRGKIPIVVGGTLYYIQSLLWPSLLDETPSNESVQVIATSADNDVAVASQSGGNLKINCSANPEICSAIVKAQTEQDAKGLYELMERIDPASSQRFHPSDTRKVNAVLEAYMRTGNAKSMLYQQQQEANLAQELRFQANILWLRCNPKEHEQRLCTRVDGMLQQGLWEEARDFILENEESVHKIMSLQGNELKRNVPESDVALSGIFQAIGYKEFYPAFLKAKELELLGTSQGALSQASDNASMQLRDTIVACADVLKIKHRQYARKQLQWIRKRVLPRNAPVHALDTTEYDSQPAYGRKKWWNEHIHGPALELCNWFGRSQEFATAPNPEAKSLEHLSKYLANDPPGGEMWRKRANQAESSSPAGRDLEKFECKLCNKTMIGLTTWNMHIASRKHRKLVSNEKKRLRSLDEHDEIQNQGKKRHGEQVLVDV